MDNIVYNNKINIIELNDYSTRIITKLIDSEIEQVKEILLMINEKHPDYVSWVKTSDTLLKLKSKLINRILELSNDELDHFLGIIELTLIKPYRELIECLKLGISDIPALQRIHNTYIRLLC